MSICIRRLTRADVAAALALYGLLAETLDAPGAALDAGQAHALLGRTDMWTLAAFDGAQVVGGLTAHVLPMTRAAGVEILVYDLAVAVSHRRRGVGRALLGHLRDQEPGAPVLGVFVFADVEDDAEAGAFYRACGGEASAATMYTFGRA
jgi:aminoglycoside 3-N-acetyltransferase I